MLGIRIHYLSGACYAAASHNRDEPEWPPHPARLFSALMAACFATGLGEAGLAALRWLERQGAPQLAASRASLRQQGLTFVPINDPENTAQKKLSTEAYHAHRWLARLPACRDRQPRRFPCAAPADPNVWMIWPTAQPDDATRQALDAMAASIGYLGNSRSLVAVALDDDPPPPTLAPADEGEHRLRIVAPGRVEELNQRFDLNLRPTPGLYQRYASVAVPPSPPPSAGDFGELIVLRQTAGPRLSLPASLTLIECVRRAALALGGDDAPAVLHGHGEHRHVAWAPLPFVGSAHADGRLLGVGLALPQGLAPALRRQVLRIVAGLTTVRLPDGRACELAPVSAEERRYTLQPETWTRPSRNWTTVTPLLLPQHPKARRPVAAIIADACRHSGLPAPAEVSIHDWGRLPGTPPSGHFRAQRQNGPRRPWTHATLRFLEPVRGPVLLGAGRYFGLGLCRGLAAAGGES